MPRFPVPDGRDRGVLVRQGGRARARRALPRRHPGRRTSPGRLRDRRHLLQMGFAGLLPGRRRLHQLGQGAAASGSGRAAAPAPARCAPTRCGITDLDPLQHGLIFERFLNPERMSMPDIDVDFDERRRGEVIRYVTEKYGDDRVAQIVTYGTIKAKQAIKDSARVLGYPYALGDQLTKADAAAGHGQGHPARRHLRPAAQALLRGRRVPGPLRVRPRRQAGRRHRARPGEPQAPVGRARGRRHHVQRAAARRHPDHAPRAGRRRSSPSSTTRAASRSAWSRWTSSACAT